MLIQPISKLLDAVSKNKDTNYLAETDGIIEAYVVDANEPTTATVLIKSDGSNPPTTVVKKGIITVAEFSGIAAMPISYHVKKGNYWRIEDTNVTMRVINWIPKPSYQLTI